jgi:hypothetical protein
MSGVVGEDLLGVFAVSVVANANGLWMVVLLRDCQATIERRQGQWKPEFATGEFINWEAQNYGTCCAN